MVKMAAEIDIRYIIPPLYISRFILPFIEPNRGEPKSI